LLETSLRLFDTTRLAGTYRDGLSDYIKYDWALPKMFLATGRTKFLATGHM